MAAFSEWLPAQMPPWLQNHNGKAYITAFAQRCDDHLARVKAAVKARFAETAPEDALPYIAQQTRLTRGPGETTAQFRARLQQAFQAWSWSGAHRGLLQYVLTPAGWPNADIIRNRDWLNVQTTSSAPTLTGSQFKATIVVTTPGTAGFSGACTIDGNDGNGPVAYSPIPSSVRIARYGPSSPILQTLVLSPTATQPGLTRIDTWPNTRLTPVIPGMFASAGTTYVVVTPSPPDGRTDLWARFWLVLPGTAYEAVPIFGDPPTGTGDDFGDPPTGTGANFGSSAPLTDPVRLLQQVDLWKPARNIFMGTFVVLPIKPDGTTNTNTATAPDSVPLPNWLEENSTWGGSSVAFWRNTRVIQPT